MKYFILSMLLATQATAQDIATVVYKSSINTAHYGVISVTNLYIASNNDTLEMNIDTEHGLVAIKYTGTPNFECTPLCPDILEVYGLPDNVIAIPNSILIPERETTDVKLYYYVGF